MGRTVRGKIVGIDLGTTNSAVSRADLPGSDRPGGGIAIFPIPQLTGPGEVSSLPMLPSFLYIPGEHEIRREAYVLPWPTVTGGFVGAFARNQGAAVPGRLVSSAKSWLCQARADRRAAILPWGAGEDVDRVSPVEAVAAVLGHIRLSWNHLALEKDGVPLEDHRIVLTVPASFDEVARDLTVEGAALAGLPHVILLEEPLAAFYSWLMDHERDWESRVVPGELILICDVGGGTTDFTLVTLQEKKGTAVFERIAVGDHLILGGDNMDLALARLAESKLAMGRETSLSLQR
ncbi:MAG TPA: Hsp70 family protein, partial [Syntrophales bacterium]|nr:Hsp70 family protein [Syntrophales bacterium]